MISRRDLIGAAASAMLLRVMRNAERVGEPTPIVDTHIHLARGLHRGERLDTEIEVAWRAMDEFTIDRAIVSPPPFPPGHRGLYGLAEITEALHGEPRLAFAAGGESLNPVLQATAAGDVSRDVLRRFTSAAEEIAAAGAAGFGELAVEHFSSGVGNHPYESAPPDHPLLLALADISASHSLPIDIHMEAVPQDMPFPPNRAQGGNPATLNANIGRFERLLDHNPQARIVWLHAGWDLTGERTIPLMRGLLERHANLAMSIKIDTSGTPLTGPFFPDGSAVRPGWMALLRDYPDRFVIGSDQFIDQGTARFNAARRFVDALPSDLQSVVANRNAAQIYRLPPRR
jgi:predicted TIM-barrel fold metal-dependent hydrolase